MSDGGLLVCHCHASEFVSNNMADIMVCRINLGQINNYSLYLQLTSNYSLDKEKNPSADDWENAKEAEFTVISNSVPPNDAILIPADSPFSSIYTQKNKSLLIMTDAQLYICM